MTTILLKTQGIYGATYNFRTDTVGSTPSGFSSISTGACTDKIIDNKSGHKRVLELHDQTHAPHFTGVTQAFSAQGQGTIEFYIECSDGSKEFFMFIDSVGTNRIQLKIDTDGSIYYNNGAWIDTTADITDDILHRISIRFRDSGAAYQGLAEHFWKFYLDDVEYGDYAFLNNGSPERLYFSTGTDDVDYYIYIDSIGYDWESYSIDDYLSLEAHTDITSKVKSFMINHPIKRTPTARGEIFNQPLAYDDIILVIGNRTSYLNSKIDQNGEIYKGTYNFRSGTVGAITAAGDLDFIDTLTLPNACTCTLLDKFREHARVLILNHDGDVDDPSIIHDFPGGSEVSGIREFYFGSSDITQDGRVSIRESATEKITIRINNSKIWHNPGGVFTDTGVVPVNNEFNHIRIDFDCVTDTYDLYIDGNLIGGGGSAFISVTTSLDDFTLTCIQNNIYSLYFDALGGSESDYTAGDNLNLEVTLADQTLFEGRVIEEGSKYVKDIKLDALSVEGEEIHPGEEGTPYNPDGYSSITSNFTEEVIAETINDKCSTNTATLTDEIYRGTYTFENDTNATLPMGIIDDSAGAGTLEVLTASLGSHKNYIHIHHADGDHGAFKILFESQTAGVVEWIVRTTDVATGMTEMNFYDSGGVVKIKLVIRGSKHKWYDGVGLTVGSAAATNTWYSYRLSFDCDTDMFSLWVDGNLEADGADFFAVSADIGLFRGEAAHDVGNPTFDSYFDAIGFSWDKFYAAASDPTDLNTYQNSHIYIPNVEVGGQTVDFSLQGEFSIERLANTVADLDVNIWKYSPDHAWLYDSGTLDNQITLTKYCKDVTGTDFLERYNTIITKGGWNAGSRVYGGDNDPDAQTTYGIKTISRFYTAIDESATPLNTIAASILALQGNTPKIVDLSFRDTTLGMFAVGETIAVPADTIRYRGNNTYLDAGAWLISSIRYDYIRDVNIMRLINTLFFEYNFSLIEELETLANG